MPAPEFVNKQTPEPITKVRPVPGFEEYAPQAAFGGGKSSKGAEELAQVSGEAMQRHQDEAMTAKVQDGHTSFLSEATKIKEQGLMVHGADALSYDSGDPNSVMDKLDMLKQKYLMNTKSDTEKQILTKMIDDTTSKFREQLSEHSVKEADFQYLTSAKGHIDQLTQTAITDPKRIDDYVDADGKKHAGYASQIRASGVRGVDANAAIENMNAGAIRKMIADNAPPEQIREFAKTHPVGKNNVSEKIDSHVDNYEGEKKANEALAKHGGDAEKALADIKGIEDKGVRDAATKSLHTTEKQTHQAIIDNKTKQFDNARSKVDDFIKKNPKMPFNPRQVLGASYDLLDKKSQDALTALGNPNRTGDVELYNDMTANAESRLGKMTKLEFDTEVIPKLDSNQGSKLQKVFDDLHPELKAHNAKSALTTGYIRSTLKDRLMKGGFLGNDPKKNDKKYTLLHDAVMRDVDLAKEGGKTLSQKDFNDIVDTQVARSGGNWVMKGSAEFEDLSKVDQDFEAKLTKKFPDITDKQILAAWKKRNGK